MNKLLLVPMALIAAAFIACGGGSGGDKTDDIEAAIVAQMPSSLPPEDSYGWPMPAFKLAIITAEVGFTERAEGMADELWDARDPETGLWHNWRGDTDIVNPFFAVMLYERLGQHDRALETYGNAVRQARRLERGAYNEFWWPVLASIIVDEPMPLDLFVRAAPGLTGVFAPYIENTPSEHGRFYADVMMAYWHALGGPSLPLYHSDWCAPENQPEQRKTMWRKCGAFYSWAEGERFLPLMAEPYGFMSDDILFFAALGGQNEEGKW